MMLYFGLVSKSDSITTADIAVTTQRIHWNENKVLTIEMTGFVQYWGYGIIFYLINIKDTGGL